MPVLPPPVETPKTHLLDAQDERSLLVSYLTLRRIVGALGLALPALDFVGALAALHPFAVCEGGVRDPAEVRGALDRGAGAVVVGTVITNVDALVRRFVAASDRARGPHTS